MKEINELHKPTIDDILEEGRAMEEAIRMAGEIPQPNNEPARSEASECRRLAIGIIAVAHSLMETPTEHGVPDPNLAYCLACTVAFAQGATISSSLIANGQFMKATAALKQDIELLARFQEITENTAVRGRTPQMSHAPEWARRPYGELNRIAHPSNFEEMHVVLSFPDGNFSILPTRQHEVGLWLYQVHMLNCVEIARAAIELLKRFLGTKPAALETTAGLEACLDAFGQLTRKVESIS